MRNKYVGKIFLAILLYMLERLFVRGHSKMSSDDKQKINEVYLIVGKYFTSIN